MALSGSELLRKVTHMSMGLFAFAVGWLGPLWSALLALTALAFNLLSCWRARLPLEGRHLVEWARACELLRDTLVHGRRQETQLTSA